MFFYLSVKRSLKSFVCEIYTYNTSLCNTIKKRIEFLIIYHQFRICITVTIIHRNEQWVIKYKKFVNAVTKCLLNTAFKIEENQEFFWRAILIIKS